MNAESQPVLFRSGLLEGEVVAVAGAGPAGAAAAEACEQLGAVVSVYDGDPLDEAAIAGALRALAENHGGAGTLVVDTAARFAAAADADLDPVRAATDGAWVAARSVATEVMIEAEQGGKIVFVAPGPGAGPHATMARAALENLARTLSIEWARYAIRPTTILPGQGTAMHEVGELVAYLASPAGDYFAGCAFALA